METNGIDKIKNKILEDAELVAKQIRSNANNESHKIIAESEEEVSKKKSEIIRDAYKQAEEIKNKKISSWELDIKKRTLNDKRGLVTECFDSALDRIVNLPDDEYIELLSGFIMKNIKTGNEIIYLSEKDRDRIGFQLLAECKAKMALKDMDCKLILSKQPADIIGGVIIKADNIEYNYSIEALLRTVRDLFEEEVVRILFD